MTTYVSNGVDVELPDGSTQIGDRTAYYEPLVDSLTGAMVQRQIYTAKGDIGVATGAGVVDNLAVGTNGQVLVADSTAATGTKWQIPGADLVGAPTTCTADTSKSLPNGTFVAGCDYIVLIAGTSSAGGVTTYKLRAAGADSSTGYNYKVFADYAIAVGPLTAQTSSRSNNTAADGGGEMIVLYRPADAVYTRILSEGTASAGGASAPSIISSITEHRVATAFDAATFFFSSAFTGEIRVYKIRNV